MPRMDDAAGLPPVCDSRYHMPAVCAVVPNVSLFQSVRQNLPLVVAWLMKSSSEVKPPILFS